MRTVCLLSRMLGYDGLGWGKGQLRHSITTLVATYIICTYPSIFVRLTRAKSGCWRCFCCLHGKLLLIAAILQTPLLCCHNSIESTLIQVSSKTGNPKRSMISDFSFSSPPKGGLLCLLLLSAAAALLFVETTSSAAAADLSEQQQPLLRSLSSQVHRSLEYASAAAYSGFEKGVLTNESPADPAESANGKKPRFVMHCGPMKTGQFFVCNESLKVLFYNATHTLFSFTPFPHLPGTSSL